MAGTPRVLDPRTHVNDYLVVTRGPLAAADVDTTPAILWTAPPGTRWAVEKMYARYKTASSTGGSKFGVERCASAVAAGSGTAIHATGGEIAADGTVDTNVHGIPDDTDGASGKNIVEGGESLFVKRTTGANVTALANCYITLELRRLKA